jgi:hypothetical protein
LEGFATHAGGMRPSFDVALLALGVALLWRGDDRGVDDLAAHCQKPGRRQHCVKALEHNLNRRPASDPGVRQRLAEAPDRIGIRHRVGQPQAEKAHKRQPVADQIFGALVRQIVAGLQNQGFEHQHVIKRRSAAFRAVRAWHGAFEIRPKQLKIHDRIQPFQAVTLGRELLQPILDIKKSRLPRHCRPPASPNPEASDSGSNSTGF